jgi:sulfur-carrier protein
MRITLKLYATLRKYLPEGTEWHTVRLEVGGADSPQNILDRFEVPPQLSHLVLLNGIYLPPEERNKPVLKDGDTLAVWPPVAGG